MLPQEQPSPIRSIRALQPLADDLGAGFLASSVLALWQAARFPDLRRSSQRTSARLLTMPGVAPFVDELTHLRFEEGAFWLSSAYAAWVGPVKRAGRALYFTPPRLAGRLINDLVLNGASLTEDRWIDPACGGAAFLAPVARRMAKALRRQGKTAHATLKHVAAHLVGNDIDPVLCSLSRQFLRMALQAEIREAGAEPEFAIRTSNALTGLSAYANQCGVAICNPPYRKMTSDEVARYRSAYGDIIENQPNIYALFFKLALTLVGERGVAGLITSTSFLSGCHFSLLRSYLLTRGATRQVDIVRNREGIFVGVQQETAISIVRGKPESPQSTRVFISNAGGRFTRLASCSLPNSGHAWPIPRRHSDVALLGAAARSPFRLSDYGYVARIGAFVWNRDRRRTFSSEQAATRHRPENKFPLIWSSDISASGTFRHGRRSSADGLDIFVNMRRPDHASVVRRPCVALQRVTSPDQRRRLVAAPISRRLSSRFGGVVGENHVVFLEQVDPGPGIPPGAFARILQSGPLDRLFRCISAAVNVSIFELNQLPLPDPARLKTEMERLTTDDAVLRSFGL